MAPSRFPMRLGLLALALGVADASPALAGPRDRSQGREIHITVRAKRIVVPRLRIEQVGEGETRIAIPASRGIQPIAFTMARIEGRFVITSLEPPN